MSYFLDQISDAYSKRLLKSSTEAKLVYENGPFILEVYDDANLLGFTLRGLIDGQDMYIVHDTDNIDRSNSKNTYLFKESQDNARHLVDMFVQSKINTRFVRQKTLFGYKNRLYVEIPDSDGVVNVFKSLSVNENTFI